MRNGFPVSPLVSFQFPIVGSKFRDRSRQATRWFPPRNVFQFGSNFWKPYPTDQSGEAGRRGRTNWVNPVREKTPELFKGRCRYVRDSLGHKSAIIRCRVFGREPPNAE